MSVQENLECDIAIIGAGFASLFCGYKLTQLGFRVAIIESEGEVLAGSSSRNEGWLHAGTYHSLSVKNQLEAVTVAARCMYGWDLVRNRFPECLELAGIPAVAILHEARLESHLARWDDAGVGYRSLSAAMRRALSETVHIADDERLFAVRDLGVNVRTLAARLMDRIVAGRGRVFTNAHALRLDESTLQLKGRHELRVSYQLLVIATGYGTKHTCISLGFEPPAVRLWRSHLVSAPKMAPTSVFGVEASEAAMINHGEWSIAGLNEDARVIDEPTFAPDPEITEQLLASVRSRFRHVDLGAAEVTACVKVDVLDDPAAGRSLNIRLCELDANTLCVFPGKMTESPFTAEAVAHAVLDKCGAHAGIASRPIDRRSD